MMFDIKAVYTNILN